MQEKEVTKQVRHSSDALCMSGKVSYVRQCRTRNNDPLNEILVGENR